MWLIRSDRFTHFNRQPGLQPILLGKFLSEPVSKGSKGHDVGTCQVWRESNNLKPLLEVEIGGRPTNELLKGGEPKVV